MPRRWAVTPGQQRRGMRQRKRQGDALYHAEMRRHIAQRYREGADPKHIARELGIPRKDVEAYMDHSLARLDDIGPHFRGDPLNPEDMPRPPRGSSRGYGPGPHVKGSAKGADDPEVFDGEILDPPDEVEFKRQAFALRKRALPFDEIAQMLGRSQDDCRRAVRQVLRSLERDELQDTALAKRMMLEQLDAMIAAITVPSTGRDIDGKASPVILEAIDRMVKLLDRKAKLLGLDAPQKIDLNHRIEILAKETGYDVEELRDIAADVLRNYAPQSLR